MAGGREHQAGVLHQASAPVDSILGMQYRPWADRHILHVSQRPTVPWEMREKAGVCSATPRYMGPRVGHEKLQTERPFWKKLSEERPAQV